MLNPELLAEAGLEGISYEERATEDLEQLGLGVARDHTATTTTVTTDRQRATARRLPPSQNQFGACSAAACDRGAGLASSRHSRRSEIDCRNGTRRPI